MFSEKFEKEFNKFKKWASEKYIVLYKSDDEKQIDWDDISIPDYTEPPRNKLELYVKQTMNIYKIKSKETNNEIENYKTIILNFKNEKTIKKRVKTDKKDTKQEKDIKKPICDTKIDSTNFHWHDEFTSKTCELIAAFGEPEYSWNDDSKHIWEWKLIINDKKYSICDLGSEFLKNQHEHTVENMCNVKWNISGESKKKSIRDIKSLYKYISVHSTNVKQKENTMDKQKKLKKQIKQNRKPKHSKEENINKTQNEDENVICDQLNTEDTVYIDNKNLDDFENENENFQTDDIAYEIEETEEIFSDSNEEDIDEIVSEISKCKMGIKHINLDDINFDDINL